MSIEVLLLSSDLALLNVIRRVCDESDIALQLATDREEADQMLARSKFDGLVVDCDDVPGAVELLTNLRKGTSNRSAVVFIIRSGRGVTVRNAFEIGANFVLDKPVDVDSANRCIRAAHGLLLRERRRYFRLPVEIPVNITFPEGKVVAATITNLSEGGLSIRSPQPLPGRTTVKVSFVLPETNSKIEAKGEITWLIGSNECGGVHFIYMTDAMQQELLMWLNAELQRVDPVLLLNANRGPRNSGAGFNEN